jgi:hypothetical protein
LSLKKQQWAIMVIVSMLFISSSWTAFADTTVSTVDVKPSTWPATVDIDVKTHTPGRYESMQESSHWWVTVLRLVQQVLGGAILFPISVSH